MLQRVAACCSVMPLMKVSACIKGHIRALCATCCSALQCVGSVASCDVLQCVAVCESIKGHAKCSVLDVR